MCMGNEKIRTFKFREGNENDLDSIFEDYVWFAEFSTLNDPYEGFCYFDDDGISDDLRVGFLTKVLSAQPMPNISAVDEVKEYYENYERETGIPFSNYVDSRAKTVFEDYYIEHKRNNRILSLSNAKDDHDFPAPLNSMLMWAHYANGFKGFCIEFDFRKLKSSIEECNQTQLGTAEVKYATDGKLPTISLKSFMESTLEESKRSSVEILKSFTHKEQSWWYENEVRLISSVKGRNYYKPDSINAIYLAQNMPAWAKSNILATVAGKSNSIPVYEVFLHPRDYKFGFRRLNA